MSTSVDLYLYKCNFTTVLSPYVCQTDLNRELFQIYISLKFGKDVGDKIYNVFSRPGQSKGLLYKHRGNSFINSVIFQLTLRSRDASIVRDRAFSHKN